jgi:CubicO group peptidase (beta-lactamase class C family)
MLPPMHFGNIGAGDMVTPPSGMAKNGGAIQLLFGRRQVNALFLPAVLLMGLLVTGCRTFSKRIVSDPAPSVARLQAGGSIGAEVDRLAQPLIDRGEIYGLAVGVVTPDGRTRAFGYGRTGMPDDAQLPGGETIFQIGSVSKLFLTALLAVLVEEGTLRYEDTVRSILPADVRLNEEVGKVTVYELVTNTGGFPRQPCCLGQLRDFAAFLFTGRNLYAYIDKPYLYRYLRKKHLKPKGARKYVYSNVGFGLLAHLIEVKTGRPFPRLLEEKICHPLHLRDTTFVLTQEQKQRLAIGHAGGQPRFMHRGHPIEPWDMGEIMRPVGCLYSTVNDLMIFAKAHLGMLQHPLEPALASTQRVQLSRPTEDVAFGWLVNYLGNDRLRVTYKQGVAAGYSGYLGMDAKARIAVVVLYNTFSWDEKVGHDLVLRLSRGLAPGQHRLPPKWPPTAQPAAIKKRCQPNKGKTEPREGGKEGSPASAAYRPSFRHGESGRTNRAPMACWLQPTMLNVAALKTPPAKASHAATHCQAEAAISPSPSTRFGLTRGPSQFCQAASSGASKRRLPCKPSHSSSSAEPADSC